MENKIEVVEKMPYCKYCGIKTRMATDSELAELKQADPTFDFPFLFIQQCNCWEENDDWMEL